MGLRNRLTHFASVGVLGQSLLLLVVLSPGAFADVIHVPEDFSTIATAINAAQDGDTIIVQPGRYRESIDFGGKTLALRSSSPLSAGTPGSQDDSRATIWGSVTISSGEGAGTVLEGFRILNGVFVQEDSTAAIIGNEISSGWERGYWEPDDARLGIHVSRSSAVIEGNRIFQNNGGILAGSSDVTIRGNIIEDNAAFEHNWEGGYWTDPGIRVSNSTFIIERNSIVGNLSISCSFDLYYGYTCFGVGGGIHLEQSSGVVEGNHIVGNYAPDGGGGLFVHDSSVAVTGNLFVENESGAVWAKRSSSIQLSRNTFVGNIGHIRFSSSTTAEVADSVLWRNTGSIIGDPTVTHSCVQGGWPGEGNIDADPLFADPASGDYSLLSTSPCIDAGNPDIIPTGPDLAGNPRVLDGDLDRVMIVDMGAYEFGNVQLGITGDGTAGTDLTINITGKDGLQSFLFLGTATGEIAFPPFGALFVDLSSFWMFLPLMEPIPSSLSGMIPPGTPPGIELVFQGIGIEPASGSGNLSNLRALTTK